MNKKNPLFIILVSEFPPGRHGGIGYWASNLHTILTEHGHNAVVLTRKSSIHRQLKLKSSDTIKYISGRSWQKMSWLYILPHFLVLLLTHKNVVVLAASWHNAAKIHRLKKLFPFTLYCSARGTDITTTAQPSKTAERRQFGRVLKNIDLLIPISGFLDRLVRKTFPEIPFKSVVIGNDVDHALFKPEHDPVKKQALRKNLGIPANAAVLLTVGRMVSFKGFPDLVRAVKPVAAQVEGFLLIMVSALREPEYSKILEAIASHGLEKQVVIKNPVEHHKLPEFYQAADAFVLWSKVVHEPMYQEEGFGRTSLEAAACGLPVVVSDTGGQPETVLDGKTGYIVPSGEKELLARRLVTLLNDRDMAEKMGKEGRAFIEKTYTAEIMEEKILRLQA